MKTAASASPVLIKWSPGRVTVIDPATAHTQSGETLGMCLNGGAAGRDAVVGVGEGSAFIRAVRVPNLPRDEVLKVLQNRLATLIPLEPSDYVFGFRLGPEIPGEGRLAVVGAVKTSSVRSIEKECEAAGLKVRAILPAAFGAWLVAREVGLAHGAIVYNDGPLNVNLIDRGELGYSRAVPAVESAEDEIARAFEIAGVDPGPAQLLDDPSQPLRKLQDLHAIDRLLFRLELPEHKAARSSRKTGRVAQIALLSVTLALVVVGVAIRSRLSYQNKVARAEAGARAALTRAEGHQASAYTQLQVLRDQDALVQAAFHPAQPFSDVLAVISESTPKTVGLEGVTLARGKPLMIRANAPTSAGASPFVKAISKNPRFSNVRLLFATRTSTAKSQQIQFAVSAHVIGNLAIDRLPRRRTP